MTQEGRIPTNWQNFLGENNNKVELFNLLADIISCVVIPNVIIVTKEQDVVSNHTVDLAGLAPCGHEEAGTRICGHVRHATEADSKVIMVI